ncbi:alcohol dehydrogenase catalytic domain-containing protein [Curtobacterium sp. MCLR17_044]|uniref:alcohol dehydrogenase catalytic domain-containing protein n=1 Tax=Curtobacterium sp. MCLR17_044 TaxID=2175628 RepID=UPI0021AC4BC8|nr:alcohol dehydrogenase catalytic domain-containing protein [Curtobacterium sp. MCLR17_044]
MRAGQRDSSQASPPYVPGMDAAGMIDEVGPDVSGWAVGDEVMAIALPLSDHGALTRRSSSRRSAPSRGCRADCRWRSRPRSERTGSPRWRSCPELRWLPSRRLSPHATRIPVLQGQARARRGPDEHCRLSTNQLVAMEVSMRPRAS